MDEITLDPRAIYREQVDSVFKDLPKLLMADVVAAAILVGFVWFTSTNYTSLMFAWFGGALMLSIIRGLLTKNLQLAATIRDNLPARSTLLLVSVVVSGLIWGSTWLILPFGSLEPPRGAIILWPCMVIAAAAVSLAAVRQLFFALTATTVTMQIVYLAIQGGPQDLQLIFGFSVYALFFLVVANRIGNDLLRSITLKLENQLLGERLAQDRITLKENEIALFQQIEREKQLLEEKLRSDTKLEIAVEEKLLLLDAAGEGIFGTNANGQITFMNAMALKLLKFDEEQVLGEDALKLVTRSNENSENQTRTLIADCLKKGLSVNSQNGHFFGNGELILPVNFSCRPIVKNERFIGAVVTFSDMSEHIQMEARLVQAQKMEAIGRITGGVAHDFNNLITAIMGNLQFLKKRLLDGDTSNGITIIEKLMQASKRGAELNNRLLTYSREQALQSEAEDIGSILHDMQEFFTRTLGEEIKFSLHVNGDTNFAMIDRSRLENTLLNLCLNARDAMPGGGELRISCERTQLAPAEKASKFDEPQEVIEIRITDTGTGIPADIQNKIFDPFFTTKKRGEGSGFGLSTSFGFIQQSGGTITVDSKVGHGATFIIQLPALDVIDIPDSNRHNPVDESRYNGTVLVVEDDENVRDVATMMLVDAGYRVITANSGPSGLNEFQKNPEIDLVFSDIIMPGGMTGIEMARKILDINPDMPVLLATGYTEKMLKDRIEEMGNVLCIPKPYDTLKLPGMIDTLMRKKTGTFNIQN